MDYCQGKANGAVDTLSRFFQWDNKEEANLWAENTWILHYLQFPLTNTSISHLNTTFSGLLPQQQVFICGNYALPQVWRFWSIFQIELANEQPYKASIGNMRLMLQELQEANRKAQELRQQKANCYEEINEILHHQGLPFIPKAIQTELISCHHNNPLAGHFGIKKTCKLLAQKYYWAILQCRGIRKRLWRLFSLQNSPSQALWKSSIVARINAPMKKPFDELCDRSTGINRLEKRQLQLHSGHR